MNKVKCECGHVNPFGTVLCESCGKPVEENDDQKELLNMRYEGVARRSQTYTTTFIDKIWMFFSSVKVGIWIIVLTLVASIFGTIFPQEMYIPSNVRPETHYAEEYGVLGQIYYQLGFHNLYGSWWYMALIAALGVSLIICSLDRVVPLYRALKTQRVTRHENFLKRQRLFGTSNVNNVDGVLETVKARLEEKKYKVREENGNLLAEKGRFSRWGPYVNHIGLIIFLMGCMFRFFPGMYVDENMWIREGEVMVVPGTNSKYYLGNESFTLELYDEEDELFAEAIERAGGAVAKNYETEAVLYERDPGATVGATSELQEVARHNIRVNDPLSYEGLSIYQIDYKLHEFSVMSFTLNKKETGESLGQIDVDLNNPEDKYDLGNGAKVILREYFPDYELNEQNVPSTRSRVPDNPGFIFEMITPETPEGEISFVAVQQNLEPLGENQYEMKFADLETTHVTGLTVRKDYTLPFLFVGGFIFMVGLIQGSYWAHRRVWLQRVNGEVWIAGHTNKNWSSLHKEIDEAIAETGLGSPSDQLEEKEKNSEREKKLGKDKGGTNE
ncbi:cytochrome c biogenesis protein ResB [Halalkalibacterium halodurans]|uniref:cytochrome c biogenesis protein ResB n=1 Tax=Halalkalibacterium halodurans TaxID=86665 RepID=UPI002E1B9A60|nr:cytochrome c biogenesis protein ResB [Halalkalibacterium halodurans]MED4086414.1 cytochrome c biogenesis protein ResB [Halalkalibacterium halodurans]MED4105050.1 cytochrome c biogenesis protein ResB [Halalkalibacterium halodurans]MED4110770.1 cytochrome c biogenesis protein ResB [Halalkalibacterium halodurans]MED4125771.1 cytochrome c biogenesis protein ResB [Halalkalibacterium halodurans]